MADIKKIATRESYGAALAEFGGKYDIVVMDADLSKSTKTDTFKNLLLDTTIIGRTWLGGTNNSVSRKIWLPSAVNLSVSAFDSSSTAYQDDPKGAFDYFINNDLAITRVAYSEENGETVRWWTRTTVGGTHPYQRTIDKNGNFSSYQYYYSAYLRPIINISSNNYLEKISDNIYRIVI